MHHHGIVFLRSMFGFKTMANPRARYQGGSHELTEVLTKHISCKDWVKYSEEAKTTEAKTDPDLAQKIVLF